MRFAKLVEEHVLKSKPRAKTRQWNTRGSHPATSTKMMNYKKVNNLIEEGYRYANKRVRTLHYYYTNVWSPDLSEAEARVEYSEKLIEKR